MEGTEQVQVSEADESRGVKDGGLPDLGAAVSLRVHLELQPQASRYLHLGREPQQTARLEPFDPPEIDSVAGAQVDRAAPAAAQPYAAPQRVEQSAVSPEEIRAVPP